MKKQIGIILAAAVVIAGVFYFTSYHRTATYIPQEFIDARTTSAKAADSISGLINNSLQNLAAVASRNSAHDYAGALKIVKNEQATDKAKQDTAAILASETEKMARAIATVEPQEARQFALEAVSDQVAIVSHVVIYEEFLHQLFSVLDAKLHGKLANPDSQVTGLLARLNNEAKVINDLDTELHASLVKFDAAVK